MAFQQQTVAMTAPVERAFRVMGNLSYLVIHGGSEELLDRAEARLRELESLWSRFLPNSDITRANRAAGTPVPVHEDTLAVVGRALDAWRQTNGRFDITVLPALLATGYTHSLVDESVAPLVPGRRIGMSAWVQVDYDAGTLTVPATSAIDLGGIGKGFAADIVAEEAIEAGATGVLVNVGGDIAVMGEPSDDVSWYLGIEHPLDPPHHVARLRVEVGGAATSGTSFKRFTNAEGHTAHHLIDPARGAPSSTHTIAATVLASDGATAESFATAAMMVDAAEAIELLDGLGLAGLLVVDDGQVFRTSTLKDFEV
jgi:thiamine biosynthesis lipoprotein